MAALRRWAAKVANVIFPHRAQMERLRYRIGRFEDEVQELRRLNRRLAEIADIVQEVLVPAANRDDEHIRKLLDDYKDAL